MTMVQVIGIVVLGACFCYAMKICCFELTASSALVGGIDVHQSSPVHKLP